MSLYKKQALWKKIKPEKPKNTEYQLLSIFICEKKESPKGDSLLAMINSTNVLISNNTVL